MTHLRLVSRRVAVDATLNGHTIHTDQPQPLGSAARVRRVRDGAGLPT